MRIVNLQNLGKIKYTFIYIYINIYIFLYIVVVIDKYLESVSLSSIKTK